VIAAARKVQSLAPVERHRISFPMTDGSCRDSVSP
jgi:hypothetical protein